MKQRHDDECSVDDPCSACETYEQERYLAEEEERALGIDEGTVEVKVEDMDGEVWTSLQALDRSRSRNR